MPSGNLNSASVWTRLELRRWLSMVLFVAAAGLAAWVSYSSMNHRVRALGFETARDRVQFNAGLLENSAYDAILNAPAETSRQKIIEAETDLRHQLEAIASTTGSPPALNAATEDLKDFLLGPMHEYYEQLFGDSLIGASNRMAVFNIRHPAVQKGWESLFSKFSTQVDRAVHEEGHSLKLISTAGFVAVPLVLIMALVAGWPGSSNPESFEALASAVRRLRSGDFTRKLSWERSDASGAAAREIDLLCEDLASSVPQVRQSASIATNARALITDCAKEQHERFSGLAGKASDLATRAGKLQANAETGARQAAQLQEAIESTTRDSHAATASAGQCEVAIRSLSTSNAATVEKLGVAIERTDAAMPLITTISKVADQANLLSLNAAIEAEKAGEYGLGFTVVAMEIRRFAEQTISAADELDRIYRDLQSVLAATANGARINREEVQAAAKLAEDSAANLSRVVQQLQSLAPVSDSAVRAAREQTTTAQDMSQALSLLSADLQKSSFNGQLQAAVRELENSAHALNASLLRWESKTQ